jgi:hypothetical protein
MEPMNRVALRQSALTCMVLLIVFPQTLMALSAGLMGLQAALNGLARDPVAALGLLLMVLACWYGVLSGWIVYFHLMSAQPLFEHKRRWALGLWCGIGVSVLLMFGAYLPVGFSPLVMAPGVMVAMVLLLLMRRAPYQTWPTG